jgi:hypothetical protein
VASERVGEGGVRGRIGEVGKRVGIEVGCETAQEFGYGLLDGKGEEKKPVDVCEHGEEEGVGDEGTFVSGEKGFDRHVRMDFLPEPVKGFRVSEGG